MSLKNSKNTPRSLIVMPLQRSWETLNKESKFIPNIYEGGDRVSYRDCHRGGYGLIQWTSINRYEGLGIFCENFGCDPSSLEGQTRWMINEPIFQRYLP